MDEATKFFFGQGILGAVCFVLGYFVWTLWQENKKLTERLEAKSEKHAEKNMETARQMTAAFEAAIRSSENRPRPVRRTTISKQAVDDE